MRGGALFLEQVGRLYKISRVMRALKPGGLVPQRSHSQRSHPQRSYPQRSIIMENITSLETSTSLSARKRRRAITDIKKKAIRD
jgi:hypothetical protein